MEQLRKRGQPATATVKPAMIGSRRQHRSLL